MKQPKVSIVMPVYNAQKYIKRSLDALVGQTHRNLEIVLIDDLSTDGGPSICREYALRDERIVYLQNEKNIGPGGARNRGMEAMTGEYVYFMDSDDDIDVRAIEILCCLFQRHGIDLAIGNVSRIDYFGNVQEDWNRPCRLYPTRGEIVELVAGWMDNFQDYRVFGSAWGKLYRTDIIRANHLTFDEEMLAWEDIQFVMCYLQHTNSACYDSRHLYFYYHNQENHGSAGTHRGYLDFRRTVNKAREILAMEAGRDAAGDEQLYGNSFTECSIRSIFNCAYRIRSLPELLHHIRTLIQLDELRSGVEHYTQRQTGFLRATPFLIRHRQVLALAVLFKGRIAKIKLRNKIRVFCEGKR